MEKILIGLHEFDGPYDVICNLPDAPGLLAILVDTEDEIELVDLRPSTNLRLLWDSICAEYLMSALDGPIKLAVAEMDGLSAAERRRALREINQEFELASCA